MEGNLRSSPNFETALNDGDGDGDGDGGLGDDVQVLAGLSTVLVATIQEVKDRVSHIEYLFCSQLFPRIQVRSRILQRTLSASDARRAVAAAEWAAKEASLVKQIEDLRLGKQLAEEDWGEKEASLVRQIEELCLEKQQAEEWGKQEASLAKQIEELRHGKQRAEEEARRLVASLEQQEAEKASLKGKLKAAEREHEIVVADLRKEIRVNAEDLARGEELRGKLLEKIDLKELEISEEKRRRKQIASSWVKLEEKYKHLKSQYGFLLKKAGLTPDLKDWTDGGACSPASVPSKRKNPQDVESRDQGGNLGAARMDEVEECTARGRCLSLNGASCPDPAIASSLCLEKFPVSVKLEQSAGQKLASSSWVDTRTGQEARGPDPHDDFLDTPMEAVRGNLRKISEVEQHRTPDLVPEDVETGNLEEEETKEMDVVTVVQKPEMSVLKPETSFKYVEPVRKKAERENLKGVECKQCKKFYDAVLPIDQSKDGRRHSRDPCEVHCEHHEGVSRHRYRYIPPMTPEGFWNIGFDSDM